MAKHKPTKTDLSAQAVALAEFAAKALVAAEQLGIKKKAIQDFPLDEAERAIATDLPGLSATLRRKLKTKTGTFTVADTASIVLAVAESLLEGEPLQQLKLLFIAKKLTDCLQNNVVPAVPAKVTAKKSKPTDTLYQFKITLLGCQASDLAANSSPGLHTRQTARTHPDGDGLDQLPSPPVRHQGRTLRRSRTAG